MVRHVHTLAVVSLATALALALALFVLSPASEAENYAPEETVSEKGISGTGDGSPPGARTVQRQDLSQDQSASEVQYSDESAGGGVDRVVSQEGESLTSTHYYEFYSRWLAREGAAKVVEVEETPSEGSAPGVRAPAPALSIMEPSTPYSQVADNATQRRFHSPRGWRESRGRADTARATQFGEDFEATRPSRKASPARFKLRIPATGHYTVYARWPGAKGNNRATHFRVKTVSGFEKVKVDQRRDAGFWVRLGAYEMERGDRYAVQVSGNSYAAGRIVADAVKVVAGTQASPGRSDDPVRGAEGAPTVEGTVRGGEAIERARTHLGTPYRHSPPMPCVAYRSEDCSCFTRLVYGKWLTLLDDPVQQWRVGRSVERPDLLPGDLVFFKEAGASNPITHVGIYSGNGNIIHSSSYWGRVVERPLSSVSGYFGAKRLR